MQDDRHADEINTFRVMLARRIDWSSANAVEESIELQAVHGTDRAALYLKSNQVDIDIALRVLTHPLARRQYVF